MKHPSKDILNAIENFRENGAGYCQVFDTILIESFIEIHDASNGEDPLPLIEAGKRAMNQCRFYIDKRVGVIAVRDRNHPDLDPERQGLDPTMPDVIWYEGGAITSGEWNLKPGAEERAKAAIHALRDDMTHDEIVKAAREAAEAAKGGG